MRRQISKIFGTIAAIKFLKFIQNFINSQYVNVFKIDMSEFKKPSEYESLTALFTRELVRPRSFDRASEVVISPSDGVCLECGRSSANRALSIKGHDYSIAELLGSGLNLSELSKEQNNGDSGVSNLSVDGLNLVQNGADEPNLNMDHILQTNELNLIPELDYANIYLSPRDYHRYHAPVDMQVLSATHIPGDLYSVSVNALARTPNLYARNERVVLKCRMVNDRLLWLVFVGALNVGKMKFNFDPRIQTNAVMGSVQTYGYENLYVAKGDELGYFELGSTIVIISEPDSLELNLFNGKRLKFSESIGIVRS